MIVLRGLQGFSGGVLIPLAFTIIVSMLPPSKRPMGLGRLRAHRDVRAGDRPDDRRLADRYLRLANDLLHQPGAGRGDAGGADLRPATREPCSSACCGSGDWLGIALMAVGLAALQTVLDEGNVYDWFGSPFIVKLSLVSAVALGGFITVELLRKDPLVRLPAAGAAQFRLRHAGQFPARLRAVWLGLSAAAVSRGRPGL